MQIAVIQMGSMFELNKVFLKVYADILEKCSDVDAVCITVYKKSLCSFYTASTFLSHFLRCPIYAPFFSKFMTKICDINFPCLFSMIFCHFSCIKAENF